MPCAMTRTTIQEGDRVVGILFSEFPTYGDLMYNLTHNLGEQVYWGSIAEYVGSSLKLTGPFLQVVRGEYDDYGGIEGFDPGSNKLVLFHEWAVDALLPDVKDLQSVFKLFEKMRFLNITIADTQMGEQRPFDGEVEAQIEFHKEIIRQLELKCEQVRTTYFGKFKIPADMVHSFDCDYEDLLEETTEMESFIFNWGDYILK